MKLQWDLLFRVAKWIGFGLTAMAVSWIACAQAIGTTTVRGTVYLANGTAGSGSLQLSWPAFTTADNRAVAAGRITVKIGSDGIMNVNLAPNLGSSPAGLYYTAVYHMGDGTTSTEYWVIPPGDQVSIAQVRAQVMPAAQAVQAASKAYVDQAIQSISQGSLTSTGGALTGPLYLNGDPTQPLQAADKRYVDGTFAQAVPLTGATMTGPLTLENHADEEIDYTLKPGLTTSQKGAFSYKDWNGANQWNMVKDASNNWALYSAQSGLDSFKANQSTNGGDTYVNATSPSGVVRVNFENGSGSSFNIYGGNNSNLYASFSGAGSIKFPGLAPASGRNCLQIDATGSMSNSGSPCSTASGTVSDGNAGQIAYYTGAGTAIGGMSTVPISAGGTGASTAAGALMALAAASLATSTAQSFQGPINAPSVNASVNSQINVMAPPFNAKGDCVTDDAPSIMAAQAAADAYPGGQATLYFPVPPGGCYLVSTIEWHGVSLVGYAGGSNWGGGSSALDSVAVLRGKPGQDILHIADPTTTDKPFHGSWRIENIFFHVDNSINGTFPHRWPGRWFDDVQMTTGSAVFKSNNSNVNCNDIGQAIQVNGAGPGGSNLVTTVQSVAPCWAASNLSWQTVTLAAAASTTVSNAHAYISLLNFPVTQTVGNCAIAADDMDGNPAHWVNSNHGYGASYPILHNVTFWGKSGQNSGNACGIFTQGAQGWYGLDAENFTFRGLPYGFLSVPAELGSWYQSSNGDAMKWNHGSLEQMLYPWITYNGGLNKIEDIEITATNHMQLLALGNRWADGLGNYLHIPEYEVQGAPGPFGLRIDGGSWLIENTAVSLTGQTAYLNTNTSICRNCGLTGALQISGSGNNFEFSYYSSYVPDPVDLGLSNKVVSKYEAAPYNQIYANPTRSRLPAKAGSDVLGRFAADFIRDGNYSTPYSWSDLVLWPQEVVMNNYGNGGVWESFVQNDSSSPSGHSLILSSSNLVSQFQQFVKQGFYLIVGSSLPAAPATVVFYAKCPAGTSAATLQVGYFNPGFGTAASKPISCTTSYAAYSMTVDLSTMGGESLFFGTTDSTVKVAWIAIRPSQADYNGFQPATVQGIQSTIAPTVQAESVGATSNFGASFFKASGVSAASDMTSPTGYALTSGMFQTIDSWPVAGSDFPAVQGQFSITAKAPPVYSTTLNGAITAGATSITLNLATTSAFPANGFLLIDNEIVQYSGTPTAGATALTITRAQGGTAAAAHSNGASVSSVFSAGFYVSCNSQNVGFTSFFVTRNWTTQQTPFDGSRCAGYQLRWNTAFQTQFTGQTHLIANVAISPFSELPYASAANQVLVSTPNGGVGNYLWQGTKPLAGSGAAIVTGPTSGVTSGHPVCYAGTAGQTQDCGVALPPVALSGTTVSIGGSALAAGQCASGTAAVSGATTSMVALASPTAYPGDGMAWRSYVSSANTVTVKVCAEAAGTPAASTYNVRVIQ
jgi:hypothetical protein